MNHDTILFSIVIPTYNRANFLPATIKALLNQTFAKFKILIVDDGSTDNTEQVVGMLYDPRLFYFKKENAERGAARNFGARLARGRYINFFDSDDLAYTHHLSVAEAAIGTWKSPEVFHLGYDVKNVQGRLIRRAGKFPPTINDELINGNHLSCNGVFIRKDIALALPFSENRGLSASEDYALWLKLASRFPIHCVNTITSTVVNHEQRSVIQTDKEKLVLRLTLLQYEVMNDAEFIRRYGKKTNVFKAFLQLYIALHLAMIGNPQKENMVYLLKALQYKPSIFFTYRFLAALKNVIL
jgi:glycosyltransferase involved in cell wall biosynthesis